MRERAASTGRPALSGPALSAALLVAAILAVASWPLLLYPRGLGLGQAEGDQGVLAWGLWRVSRLQLSPTLTGLRFPEGGSLLLADLPESLVLAPVTRLAGPLAAFTLWQALHPVLAAAAAAALARSRGAGRAGALVAGLALGLSPVMLCSLHNGNPEVTPLYLVPLAALLAGRLDRGPSAGLGLGLVLGLAAWCNPYVALMAGLASAVALPRGSRPVALGLAAVLGLALGGAWLLLARHSMAGPDTLLNKELAGASAPGSAGLLGLAWPLLSTSQTGGDAHMAYLGLVLLGLAGAGTLWALRRGAARDRSEALRWSGLALVGAVLALGPALHLRPPHAPGELGLLPLPWALAAHLPGMAGMYLVFRFAALGSLGLSLLAGRAVDRLPRAARVLAVAAVAADLLLLAPGARWLQAQPLPSTPSCALLAPLPPGPVIDLPGRIDGSYLLAQTCHDRPVASGIHQAFGNDVRRDLQQPAPLVLDALGRRGFAYLVLHRDLEGERQGALPALERRARREGRVVAESGELLVVDLSPVAGSAR